MKKFFTTGASLLLAAGGLRAQSTVTGYLNLNAGFVNGANHDGNFILTGFNGPGWVFHPSGNQSLYLMPGWDFNKGARF